MCRDSFCDGVRHWWHQSESVSGKITLLVTDLADPLIAPLDYVAALLWFLAIAFLLYIGLVPIMWFLLII